MFAQLILAMLFAAGIPATWTCHYDGATYTVRDLATIISQETLDMEEASVVVALMDIETAGTFNCMARACAKRNRMGKCTKFHSSGAMGLLQVVPNKKMMGSRQASSTRCYEAAEVVGTGRGQKEAPERQTVSLHERYGLYPQDDTTIPDGIST